MKNNYIFIVIAIIVLVTLLFIPADKQKTPVPDEAKVEGPREPVMINDLQYHKNMENAQRSKEVLKVAFGAKEDEVGGFMQDSGRYTEGYPWGFRKDDQGDFWVLDSINKKLKLFNEESTFVRSIDIEHLGVNVIDFAIYPDGEEVVFAFLNKISGEIFFTDPLGQVKNKFEGFVTANSIEFTRNGELLVDLPIAQGVVKIAQDGQLRGIYKGDGTLSMVEARDGGLYGLEFEDKKAKLFHRKDYPETARVDLATFEYELNHHLDVWFAGGTIYGYDAEDNIYLGLVVCDIRGVIYRERIYKCDPNGKELAHVDTISIPVLSGANPRKKFIARDGKMYFHYHDEENYYVGVHSVN
jgi:hypothetical protein